MKNISIEGQIEDINSRGFRRIEDPAGTCIIMYSRYMHVVYTVSLCIIRQNYTGWFSHYLA